MKRIVLAFGLVLWASAASASCQQGSLLGAFAANTLGCTQSPIIGANLLGAGSLGIAGATSGTAVITVGAVAGTPTITLPTTTGTLAILGANTFIANQNLTLTTNGTLQYSITNASTGTSAVAAFGAVNSANGVSFGIGGTGFTGIPLLQNRAFINTVAGTDGIVFHNVGDDPIIFAVNSVERGRWPVTGTTMFRVGVTGTALGSIGFAGSSTGEAILAAQAAAGTPTLLLGTTSGTLAGSATSPLAISATTGVITCTTCGVTGTGLNQFASTTSAQLAGVISDETGTAGKLVFDTSPTFQTSITSTANATAVTPPANTLIHAIAANSTAGQTALDSFATFGTHTFRRANTSAASPSGLVAADLIGGTNARGYTSAGSYITTNAAAFFFAATETWSGTQNGAEVQFYTTANTTTTLLKVMTIQNSGGLSIGATTDPGAGGLFVNGATVTLNGLATDATHTDRTVCQDATSKTLFFGSGVAGICLGTSGAQFKTAFAPMVAGLDEVVKLNLQNYRYRDGYGDNGARIQYGLTAQDVEAVIPDLARHNLQGETINYDWAALVFVGLRAIQQLKADNDNLRVEIEALKQRIAR